MLRFAWLMICTCFWILLNPWISKSQDKILLRIESGGSVHFSINSMRKYEEGMALENWTRLAVSFNDEDDPDAEWQLQFRAMSEFIKGDYDYNLPLDYMFVEVSVFTGTLGAAGDVISSPIELTSGFQTLIRGATQGDFNDNKIHISYRLGDDAEKQLKGNPFGYFTVEIQFCLTKEGPPCEE